jgi:photosystem II stability/assembly factor-like uncharacterized protein
VNQLKTANLQFFINFTALESFLKTFRSYNLRGLKIKFILPSLFRDKAFILLLQINHPVFKNFYINSPSPFLYCFISKQKPTHPFMRQSITFSFATFLFLVLFSGLILTPTPVHSQDINLTPTGAEERSKAIEYRKQMREQSIFKEYPVRNVGPVVMSGRITDIAVHKHTPRHFYVAYASGGVFETTNSGNTMTPIFDHQGTITIGDIAISRADSTILWLGTGENNSSRSSYAGDGIYKSSDGGETWKHAGLTGSQHIGRIRTHPDNPDIAWAASMGPLYSVSDNANGGNSYNEDANNEQGNNEQESKGQGTGDNGDGDNGNDQRGVYKTTDGGETWNRTLSPPDSTGVIDLVIDPKNPDRMWASTWQRFREAWNFQEAGEGSAIYLSTDGGETWSKSMDGFPEGASVGRIGLDVSASNPDILYAYLDNQKETKVKKDEAGAKEEEEQEDQLRQSDFLEMTKKEFAAVDNEKLNQYLRSNGFPQHYNAQRVKNQVREGLYEPKALAEYLGDANSALFETEIEGAQVYRSVNGGKSWREINSYALDNVIYTYGYYFGEVRVSPSDPDVVYITGVPALKSTDGGKTWSPFAENQPVHVDHHALWIDPQDPEHLLLGNDGGLYESHDAGINFIKHNTVSVGQFYSVAVDMEQPYNIYGGLQDNGVFTGSSKGSPDDQDYWERIFGGDGMHVAVDPRNSDRIYTGFQFGNYYRIDQSTQKTTRITPQHDIGEDKFRFNWNTPIEMSSHNPDVMYIGSQHIHRSFDRGENWKTISPDITNGKEEQQAGDVPYSTMTSISESPLNFNVIWAGTDDGNVQVTRDGGESWTLVSGNLPQLRWVSQVHASNHDAGTAYVSLNGYRYDEFKTYLYKTTDYGQSWESVKGNLPESVANVIIQDPEKPETLYAGLDFGTFVSFDDGGEWFLLNGVPNVPSYDMIVHPRDMDLVVGTHGRSIYVADLEPVHAVAGRLDEPIVALETQSVPYSDSWGSQPVQYRPANEPQAEWMYWIGDKDADNASVQITVKDTDGNTVTTLEDEGSYGFNSLKWNLKLEDEQYLGQGKYTIVYEISGNEDTINFEVMDSGDNDRADQRVFGSPDEVEYEEYE